MATVYSEIHYSDENPDGVCEYSYDGEAMVSVRTDAENGCVEPGPLSWLNSATIRTKPSEDSVVLSVSVGDPRGAFTMEVRRTPDGRILLHVPHPGECLPHMPTRGLNAGTLEIVHDSGNTATFRGTENSARDAGIAAVMSDWRDAVALECGFTFGEDKLTELLRIALDRDGGDPTYEQSDDGTWIEVFDDLDALAELITPDECTH